MAIAFKFNVWKSELRNNSAKEGKLPAFGALDDFTLLLFFERGIEPTPQAIVEDGNKAA
jgi:hypothetical protein